MNLDIRGKIAIACTVGGLMSGCASAPSLQAYSASTTVTSVPAIGVDASAEVGQTIISKASMQRVPAIRLQSDISENINGTGQTTVKAGLIPLWATGPDGSYYRDYKSTFTVFGSASLYGAAGVFVPSDKSKPTVIYHAPMAGNYGKTPITNLEHTTADRWVTDSFRRELVYSGVSQNTITLLYREFNDNIARPAFSQELHYDLAQGNTIGYKGARFEVIKATNLELKYRVLKALD